ncbi:MAG: hypothetical protein ABIW38_02450 [Ferruginibacter sp.]
MNKKIQNIIYKTTCILAPVLICSTSLFAQRDTTRKQSIDITSSYKPVLRNAIKINFSGSQLPADTSRSLLQYNIPAQNLFYAYQPISLRPLALAQDTNLYLGMRRYIKAGFGSYTTPYVNAGFSFGDGKKSLVNIYGDYIASKGTDIVNQDYSQVHIKGAGSLFSAKNEVYASAAISREQYYLYGYDHKILSFTKDQVSQQFQDVTTSIGIRNTVALPYRISYDPHVKVNFFTNIDKLSETTIRFDLPVEKKIAESFALKVEATGAFTNYSTKNYIGGLKLTNNLIQLAPSLKYVAPRLHINAGLTPVWNNGAFEWLPNIYAEAQLQEKVFMLQAGFVGRYINNTYHNLSAINPYLAPIKALINTREAELYGGIKASLGSHFNVSAKASWISYENMPLFINDTASNEKSFRISNERSMNNLRIHGNASYINQDKFTVTAALTLNGYTGLNDNAKAWHTIPMEFSSSIRWLAFERILIKGDFKFFNGGKYLAKNNNAMLLSGGTDLSAGAEFKINKQFSVWLDINNILNDKYERWHNYPVYGLNLLGGILIHF